MIATGFACTFSLDNGVEVVETDDDVPPPLPADGLLQTLLTAPTLAVGHLRLNADPVVVVPASAKVATRPTITMQTRPIGVLCQPVSRDHRADGRQSIGGYAIRRVYLLPMPAARGGRKTSGRLRAMIEDVVGDEGESVAAVFARQAYDLAVEVAERLNDEHGLERLRKYPAPGNLADVIAASGLIGTDEAERRLLLNTGDTVTRLRIVIALLQRELARPLPVPAKHVTHAASPEGIGDRAQADIASSPPNPPNPRLLLPYGVQELIEAIKTVMPDLPSDERLSQRQRISILEQLPWDKRTTDTLDIEKATAELDEKFVGMRDAKRRLVEFLAVRKLGGDAPTVILLDGPPGTGKTAFGQSIAKILGRKFVKYGMAGIVHPFELGGSPIGFHHAGPGKLLTALQNAGVSNPVIMLDEIDKLGAHRGGDPSHVLLSALDPMQNTEFVDAFLDVPVDFSNVVWILTCNDTERIPRPVLDRAEIIQMHPYTDDEQFDIARFHLVPDLAKTHGLKPATFRISDEALQFVVRSYRSAAGVRDLGRRISALMRVTCVSLSTGGMGRDFVSTDDVQKVLGAPETVVSLPGVNAGPGVVGSVLRSNSGWTPVSIICRANEGLGRVYVVASRSRDELREAVEQACVLVQDLRPDVDWPRTDLIASADGAFITEASACVLPLALAMLSALDGVALPNVVSWGDASLTGALRSAADTEDRLGALRSFGASEQLRVITAPLLDVVEPKVDAEWLHEHVWTATLVAEAYELAKNA